MVQMLFRQRFEKPCKDSSSFFTVSLIYSRKHAFWPGRLSSRLLQVGQAEDTLKTHGNISCSLRPIGTSSFVPLQYATCTLSNVCLLHSCCCTLIIIKNYFQHFFKFVRCSVLHLLLQHEITWFLQVYQESVILRHTNSIESHLVSL